MYSKPHLCTDCRVHEHLTQAGNTAKSSESEIRENLKDSVDIGS